jgi:hypothetical protein
MKIAVYYHCKLSGEGIVDPDFAQLVMAEQMNVLHLSGLLGALTEFHVGVNGGDRDARLAELMAPAPAVVHVHGPSARTEIPTLNLIRARLEPGWFILYHHSKGITHPNDLFTAHWRRCMEKACVRNWTHCIGALVNGSDSAGAHWLSRERFGPNVTTPFWGGTFWWARSEHLLKLPPLPEPTWANRWEAESWIGKVTPKVTDFAPHWPNEPDCSKA